MHDSFENQTDFHRETICSLLILDTSLFWRLLCLFIVNSITTRHGGVEVKMYSIGTFLFAKCATYVAIEMHDSFEKQSSIH
jgi:hypothetical protein